MTVARRAAATGSLVALAGTLALALWGVVGDVVPVLSLVASLLVAVAAGWYVVTRRGRVRVLAGVVAVCGVGGAVAALVIADLSVIRVIASIVLAGASVSLARWALQLQPSVSGQEDQPPAPVKPVLLMNPVSGGGKTERFNLAHECERRGVTAIVVGPSDDLASLAIRALDDGADVIGMAGGDGSQALVASLAASRDIPLVVVPAGTRNHFAVDLGLDRNDVVGSLDAFSDYVERRIDLGDVNGRTFVNNASLGVYASIVQRSEYRDAKLATTLDTLPELLGSSSERNFWFTGPDGDEVADSQVVLVSNNPYQLARFGGRGARERLDTGSLGIVALHVGSASGLSSLVALETIGQLGAQPGLLRWEASRFEVRANGSVPIGIDGEAATVSSPIVFRSRPGALRVRTPRSAGASPAARAPHVVTRATVARLVRIALGHEAVASRATEQPPISD